MIIKREMFTYLNICLNDVNKKKEVAGVQHNEDSLRNFTSWHLHTGYTWTKVCFILNGKRSLLCHILWLFV